VQHYTVLVEAARQLSDDSWDEQGGDEDTTRLSNAAAAD
jgi:hypothetical protein